MRIPIYNQKGGTGKTTTAVNLGAALADLGKKVTLVDLCPQGDSTLHLGYKPGGVSDPFSEGAQPIEISRGFRLLPAYPRALSLYDLEQGPLRPLTDGYLGRGEVLILDCPPSGSRLSTVALTAADRLIIPMSPGYLSYAAVEAVSAFVDSIVEAGLKKSRPPVRLLLTQYDHRRKVDRATLAAMKDLGIPSFDTTIPYNTDLNRAASEGRVIFDSARRSRGAAAYRDLAKEVLAW